MRRCRGDERLPKVFVPAEAVREGADLRELGGLWREVPGNKGPATKCVLVPMAAAGLAALGEAGSAVVASLVGVPQDAILVHLAGHMRKKGKGCRRERTRLSRRRAPMRAPRLTASFFFVYSLIEEFSRLRASSPGLQAFAASAGLSRRRRNGPPALQTWPAPPSAQSGRWPPSRGARWGRGPRTQEGASAGACRRSRPR